MTDDTWTTNDRDSDEEALADVFRSSRADTLTAASCPAPELVQASQMGTLPAPVQERVARHVAHCAVCQVLAEVVEDSSIADPTPAERDRILARIRRELGQPERLPSRNRWRLAMAAVVALAISGSVLLWQSRRAPQQDVREGRTPDAIAVLHLEKAPVDRRGGTDLVWRGSADTVAAQELDRALESYRVDDYAEAARRLRTLVNRYPQNASAHFYLGVSDLFLAADADAISALENAERLAKGEPHLTSEATWYLALAYYRTGQTERTVGKLDALCRGGSSRAARACAVASEISKGSSAPRSR